MDNENENSGMFAFGLAVGIVLVGLVAAGAVSWLTSGPITGPLLAAALALKNQGK